MVQPWDDESSQTQLTAAERVRAAEDAETYTQSFPDGSKATLVRSRSQNAAVLTTQDMADAPAGSIYEEAVTEYEDVLEDYIDSQGFVTDEAAAIDRLDDGELDVVVVFPADPLEQVLAGDSADIEIIHTELDPFKRGAMEIAARLAVQEVNASVLGTIAGQAQEALAIGLATSITGM